ncbi:MAG: hypothetical protein ABIW84_00100 [Ilumatobacteraceae bacterium]
MEATQVLRPTAEKLAADQNVVEAAQALYDTAARRLVLGPDVPDAKECETCEGIGLVEHPVLNPEAAKCSACGGLGVTTGGDEVIAPIEVATTAEVKAAAAAALDALEIAEVA